MRLTLAQAVLLHTAWSGARVMVGISASRLTTDPAALAVVAAGFAVPAIVLALPTGLVLDRIGPRPLVLAGSVVAAAGLVLIALAASIPGLVLANVLLGIGQLLCMIGQQADAARRAGDGTLDSAFGALTSAMAIGQAIGPVAATGVGTLLARAAGTGVVAPGIMLCGACLLTAAPLVRAMRSGRQPSAAVDDGPRDGSAPPRVLVPGLWRALLVSGVVLAAVDLLYVFLPAWAQAAGASALAVGWLLSLRALVTVLCRLGLDRLVRRWTRTTVLVAALVAGAVGFSMLLSDVLTVAFVAMAVLGAALGIPQPLTLSWVVQMTHASVRGRALGLRLTANRCIQVALPVTIGAVAAPFGTAGMFLGSSIVLLVAGAVAATSRRTLDGPPDPVA